MYGKGIEKSFSRSLQIIDHKKYKTKHEICVLIPIYIKKNALLDLSVSCPRNNGYPEMVYFEKYLPINTAKKPV